MRHPLPRTAHGAHLAHVFLLPAGLHCARVPTLVTTVLGSCVAVCLWDRVRQVGGINHFVLPDSGGDRPTPRHGNFAIDELTDQMLALGCTMANLEAKVFGGAAVLPVNMPENNVGARNAQVALERLQQVGIPIVAHSVGGTNGRFVRLFTQSGDVYVRRVGALATTQPGARHAAAVRSARA